MTDEDFANAAFNGDAEDTEDDGDTANAAPDSGSGDDEDAGDVDDQTGGRFIPRGESKDQVGVDVVSSDEVSASDERQAVGHIVKNLRDTISVSRSYPQRQVGFAFASTLSKSPKQADLVESIGSYLDNCTGGQGENINTIRAYWFDRAFKTDYISYDADGLARSSSVFVSAANSSFVVTFFDQKGTKVLADLELDRREVAIFPASFFKDVVMRFQSTASDSCLIFGSSLEDSASVKAKITLAEAAEANKATKRLYLNSSA
jgi:hypothetical protein